MSSISTNNKNILSLIILSSIMIGILFILVNSNGKFNYWKHISKSNNKKINGKNGLFVSGLKNYFIIDLGSFTVNLLDNYGKRLLKVGIKLELYGGDFEGNQINNRIAEIRDNILILLSTKSFNDIDNMVEKRELSIEIKDTLNKLLSQEMINKVYFTQFISQLL